MHINYIRFIIVIYDLLQFASELHMFDLIFICKCESVPQRNSDGFINTLPQINQLGLGGISQNMAKVFNSQITDI